MSRRGRRNWSNLEINKRICKQLILHRIWNDLSQRELAENIGTTPQQFSKVEKCENRLFTEQLASICKNRGWRPEIIIEADPYETLRKWFKRDYGNAIIPDKYTKILRSWDVLDKTAQRNYYGEEPIPFVVDSIEKGN